MRDDEGGAEPDPGAAAAGRRRSYQPPGVEWEEEIDVKANLASACGKVLAVDMGCAAVQIS